MQPAALRIVFDWLAPSVAGYLRARGAQDPDGLTNDVFLRVYRRIGAFDGDRSSFKSWVFTIAHNALIDEHRKRQREVSVVALDGSHDRPGGDVESAVLYEAGLEEAARMLTHLTDDQRTVIYLRIVAGLSVAETATVMQRDAGAIKALQHRGLATLRRTTGDQPEISSSQP